MKTQPLVSFATVALSADVVATLANPSAYAADLIHVETDLIQKSASQYGASQTAVRAGQEFFAAVVAALDVLRATAPDTVRAVYKRLHAACIANNAPFIVQSRKSGLSVVVRAETVAAPESSESSESDKIDAPAAKADERDATIAKHVARIAELEAEVARLTALTMLADDRDTVITKQAEHIAGLRAEVSGLTEANLSLVVQLEKRAPRATARKRALAA